MGLDRPMQVEGAAEVPSNWELLLLAAGTVVGGYLLLKWVRLDTARDRLARKKKRR